MELRDLQVRPRGFQIEESRQGHSEDAEEGQNRRKREAWRIAPAELFQLAIETALGSAR